MVLWGATLLLLAGGGAPVNGWQVDAAPTLLLTEVYYDTPGVDEAEEWLEIANVGPAVIDLSHIKVGFPLALVLLVVTVLVVPLLWPLVP